MHEAKTHLSSYVERLEKGDEEVIVLCRRNEPIAEIRALPKRRSTKRPICRPEARGESPTATAGALRPAAEEGLRPE